MSRLVKATIAVVILAMLFMPAAMAATVASFDATQSQRIPLPDGSVRGPESVAFDGKGQGPYSSVSDGRVLKWNGDELGWTTYTDSPDYNTTGLLHRSMQVGQRGLSDRATNQHIQFILSQLHTSANLVRFNSGSISDIYIL
jgi:hypothetical protein